MRYKMDTIKKVLICASELNPDSSDLALLNRLMDQGVDIDRMIHTAIYEGMAGLLYMNLKKSGWLEKIDVTQRNRLKSFYYYTLRSNLKLIHDLKEVLKQLNKKNIDVVLLQGMSLLNRVYQDIGLRSMMDIDLWILEKSYSDFIKILENLGYKQDPLYHDTFRKGPTVLDVHTHFMAAERIKARALLLWENQENIFGNTTIINFEGYKARCLNIYDQILFLGLHALKHNADRLIWLVDIKNLLLGLKDTEKKTLVFRAEKLGQEKSLIFILYLIGRLFDFHTLNGIEKLTDVKMLSPLEKKTLNRRITGHSLPMWSSLVLFPSGKRVFEQIYFIIETLFPRPEILRQVFNDSSNIKVWHLYLKRVFQLVEFMKIAIRKF